MGGEDFSRYGRAGVPIFMFRLGTVETKRLAGLHAALANRRRSIRRLYYPDPEPTLRDPGLTAMATAVVDLFAAEAMTAPRADDPVNRVAVARAGGSGCWPTLIPAGGGGRRGCCNCGASSLETMDTPEARAQWQEWREAEPNPSGPRLARAAAAAHQPRSHPRWCCCGITSR